MSDTTVVEGPFVDPDGGMFIVVDDETNRHWLQEEIDSCWQAVQDEEEDLERRAAETARRVQEIHAERIDLERQLSEAP